MTYLICRQMIRFFYAKTDLFLIIKKTSNLVSEKTQKYLKRILKVFLKLNKIKIFEIIENGNVQICNI